MPGKRESLFKDPVRDQLAKDQLKKQLPEGWMAASAFGGGACFFDSFALGLNMQGGGAYTEKGLRLLCHEYVVELDKKGPRHPDNWIYKYFENRANELIHLETILPHERKSYADDGYYQYMGNIAYTVEECNAGAGVKNGGLATWGEQNLDGRILCEILNKRLHVIEIRGEKDIPDMEPISIGHNLVDSTTSHAMDGAEIEYLQDNDIVHIANYSNHFVPVLTEQYALELENAQELIPENVNANPVPEDLVIEASSTSENLFIPNAIPPTPTIAISEIRLAHDILSDAEKTRIEKMVKQAFPEKGESNQAAIQAALVEARLLFEEYMYRSNKEDVRQVYERYISNLTQDIIEREAGQIYASDKYYLDAETSLSASKSTNFFETVKFSRTECIKIGRNKWDNLPIEQRVQLLFDVETYISHELHKHYPIKVNGWAMYYFGLHSPFVILFEANGKVYRFPMPAKWDDLKILVDLVDSGKLIEKIQDFIVLAESTHKYLSVEEENTAQLSNNPPLSGLQLGVQKWEKLNKQQQTHLVLNTIHHVSENLQRGCEVVVMPKEIEKDPTLAIEYKLYVRKKDGYYISKFNGKIHDGSLHDGEFADKTINLKELDENVLKPDFQKQVLAVTSKRGDSLQKTPAQLPLRVDGFSMFEFKLKPFSLVFTINKKHYQINIPINDDEALKLFIELVAYEGLVKKVENFIQFSADMLDPETNTIVLDFRNWILPIHENMDLATKHRYLIRQFAINDEYGLTDKKLALQAQFAQDSENNELLKQIEIIDSKFSQINLNDKEFYQEIRRFMVQCIKKSMFKMAADFLAYVRGSMNDFEERFPNTYLLPEEKKGIEHNLGAQIKLGMKKKNLEPEAYCKLVEDACTLAKEQCKNAPEAYKIEIEYNCDYYFGVAAGVTVVIMKTGYEKPHKISFVQPAELSTLFEFVAKDNLVSKVIKMADAAFKKQKPSAASSTHTSPGQSPAPSPVPGRKDIPTVTGSK